MIIAQHKGRGQKIYGFPPADAGAQWLRKFSRLVLNGKLVTLEFQIEDTARKKFTQLKKSIIITFI